MDLVVSLIIGLTIFITIHNNIIIGLKVCIIYLFFIEWVLFNILYFNSSVKIVEDFIVLGLFTKSLIGYSNFKSSLPKFVKLLSIIIIALGVFSGLINFQDPFSVLIGLRRIFLFFVLLYSISKIPLSNNEIRGILKYFLIIGFIQFPFVFAEFLFWDTYFPPRDGLTGWDANTGTFPFSGQQILSFYLLGISFLLLAKLLLIPKTKKLGLIISVLYLCLSLPFASSGGAVAISGISMLIMLLIILRYIYKFNAFRIAIVISLVFSIGIIFYKFSESIYEGQLSYLFDYDLLMDYQLNYLGTHADQGRIAVINFVWDHLISNGQLLFGYGPGNFLSADFIGQRGANFNANILMAGTIQVSSTLGEIGLIPLIFIFILIISIIIYFLKYFLKFINPLSSLINIFALFSYTAFLGSFVYICSLGFIQLIFPLCLIFIWTYRYNLNYFKEYI